MGMFYNMKFPKAHKYYRTVQEIVNLYLNFSLILFELRQNYLKGNLLLLNQIKLSYYL